MVRELAPAEEHDKEKGKVIHLQQPSLRCIIIYYVLLYHAMKYNELIHRSNKVKLLCRTQKILKIRKPLHLKVSNSSWLLLSSSSSS